METYNKMKLTFSSKSENEAFARGVISCFALTLNPSISELTDIKTAVSEAVTNAIVHAYQKNCGEITLEAEIVDNNLHINVFDDGVGILKQILLYTYYEMRQMSNYVNITP